MSHDSNMGRIGLKNGGDNVTQNCLKQTCRPVFLNFRKGKNSCADGKSGANKL